MRSSFSPAIIDLFISLFAVISVLFFFCIILINENNSEKQTPRIKCEYLVTLTWEKTEYDVDLWANFMSPELTGLCGYSRREIPPFILHNDHTGSKYADGFDQMTLARETLEISGKRDGRYQFSLHPFRVLKKTTCLVTVEQINPYKLIYEGSVDVDSEEKPFLEFGIENESISYKNTDEKLLERFLYRKF